MMKSLQTTVLALALALISGMSWAAQTVTYYHLDAQGSTIAATNEQGNLMWREAYEPYGVRLRKESTSSNTTWYTGKQEDAGAGLSYFGARWYDPEIGRFMGIDPVGFMESNPQSFNRFAYANNNPYKFVDPDGNLPIIAIAFFAFDTYQGYQESGNLGDAMMGAALGMLNPLKKLKTVSKVVTKEANKAPDFVVSPGGTAFPVPKGASGPTPVVNPGGKTTGSAFTGGKGGANGQVDTMRIMDSTPPKGKSPGYPNGYIKYENKSGQGVDPYTGRTISNKDSHFPID